MARLEDLTRGAAVRGILPDGLVMVVDVKWIGSVDIELTYKDSTGRLGNELIYRDREPTIDVVTIGKPWNFDGDGSLFRLVSEAHRIRLAHLFDPWNWRLKLSIVMRGFSTGVCMEILNWSLCFRNSMKIQPIF